MKTELGDLVQYWLEDENQSLFLNDLIGKEISMIYDGKAQCCSCQKFVKKIFSQGFCYDCFMKSASAGTWIMKPELSTAHLGIEDRDLEYEKKVQLQPHIVYLAVASNLKVGVTRKTQIPTRWIDQGASYAIKIAETPHRQLAGEIEVALKQRFTDKTSWQQMLKNEIGDFDLITEKWELEQLLPNDLSDYMTDDDDVIEINYPVLEYPEKIKSVGFDKEAKIEGKLMGIKGQYLILDQNRVINMRKHEGYFIDFEVF